MERIVHGVKVKGLQVDPETRCEHYAADVDIIAIKFACCDTYYPCRECHDALRDHDAKTWKPAEFGEKAVLCGHCGRELTIEEYLRSDSRCPECHAPFNPRCSFHYHSYFDVPSEA
ncbi:CHY zinc finger protein [Alicyclobacillus ferrooxydans]|uniref:CHY-type domain-containing protein n=1 Tax=Alicyclobacillus ferrooxydans TaxID=471514 RepID=A0A0P9CQ63_9BACL|nr:CHY zinc finger protein [Alicyclobacillus ferrooxydans]KPV45001.1 hypothetical protein AN477_04345 [Alicyclobacillus ferrooxydans]